uniref:family 20 glycosylhydrolase n=1 Tax=Flavobacterium sp. TaxID=239 RepID=UPI0025BCE5DA
MVIHTPKFLKIFAIIILYSVIVQNHLTAQDHHPQSMVGLNPNVYGSPMSIQIPKPRIYFQEKGVFNPSSTLYWYADPHITNLAPEALHQLTNALDEFISYTTPKGINLVPTNNIKKAKIQILLLNSLRDPNNISLPTVEEQGYTMDVTSKSITVKIGGIPAIFNIISNIQQWIYYYTDIAPSLFPDQNSYPLNCFTLRDYPEYAYRGMHIDISRHFFRQEHIFQYLDMMSMYKFNVLHLHL